MTKQQTLNIDEFDGVLLPVLHVACLGKPCRCLSDGVPTAGVCNALVLSAAVIGIFSY